MRGDGDLVQLVRTVVAAWRIRRLAQGGDQEIGGRGAPEKERFFFGTLTGAEIRTLDRKIASSCSTSWLMGYLLFF